MVRRLIIVWHFNNSPAHFRTLWVEDAEISEEEGLPCHQTGCPDVPPGRRKGQRCSWLAIIRRICVNTNLIASFSQFAAKSFAGTKIYYVHTVGSLIPPHSEKLSRLASSHLALQMFEYCLPFLSLQSEEGGAVQVLSAIILGCDWVARQGRCGVSREDKEARWTLLKCK